MHVSDTTTTTGNFDQEAIRALEIATDAGSPSLEGTALVEYVRRNPTRAAYAIVRTILILTDGDMDIAKVAEIGRLMAFAMGGSKIKVD